MTFVVIKKTLNQICAHYIICKHCDSIHINVEKKYIINMILLLQLRSTHQTTASKLITKIVNNFF